MEINDVSNTFGRRYSEKIDDVTERITKIIKIPKVFLKH